MNVDIAIPDAPQLRWWNTDRAVATEAVALQDGSSAAVESYLRTEQSRVQRLRDAALDEAFEDCSQRNWDGYGAAPANPLSMEWARKVLAAFPNRMHVPEIAFEPDGDAGLEWWYGPSKVLSVSVGFDGEIRYAARLNAVRLIGTEVFADGLPRRLVEIARDFADE